MSRRAQTAAILTAGGASSRMGQPKALLVFPGGRTLVEHQCLQLHGFSDAIVMTGATKLALPLPHPARIVHNPDWEKGRQTGIALAARTLLPQSQTIDAVLVCAIDQPLTARVIEALLGAFEAPLRRPIVPTCNDRGGHPVLIPAAMLPLLAQLDHEPEGLRSLFSRTGVDRLALPYDEVLRDLNRPEDWQHALDSGIFV